MRLFLPRALASVEQQKYNNLEVIVVDDGSDEALDTTIFSRYDFEITFLKTRHQGKSAAVNCAFRKAKGNYITILDADDELATGSLLKRVKALTDNSADLCIGSFSVCYNRYIKNIRRIDHLITVSNEGIIRHLLSAVVAPFHQNAMLFRHDLLKSTGLMDTRMKRSQDKDYAIRLLRKSKHTTFIEAPVYIYHKYERPFFKRLRNRLVGMKYKMVTITRHISGWRRIIYLIWGIAVEGGKFVHDLFGIYKR